MHLVGAKLKNFYEFTNKNEGDNHLESCEVQVKIPHYQRPYEWTKDNVSLLITDTLNNTDGKYFSGASVSSIHNEYCHELVDGQQRYTTLFLINYCVFLISRVALREALLLGAFVHAKSLAETLKKSMEYVFILNKDGKVCKSEIIETQKEIEKEIELDDPDYEKIANLKERIKSLKINDSSSIEPYSKTFFENAFKELLEDIATKGNSKVENTYEDVLENFNRLGVLSSLNQSCSNYFNENKNKLEYFFNNSKFRITYSRKKHVNLIRDSLLSIDFTLSSQNCLELHDSDTKNETTYKDAIKQIFEEISDHVTLTHPLDSSVQILKVMTNILESIDICVVQTGNQSDATVLFDVLNDRSKELSQLSLIKNEFYKRVVIYNDKNNLLTDEQIDQHIDKVDELWVDEIFNASISDAALVSYLGTCFLSGSTSTNFNSSGKETRATISDYLKNQSKYSVEDLKFDISVFQAVKIILQKVGVKYQKTLSVSLTAEAEHKSIFERLVKLLVAKNQAGILSGIVNFILWKAITQQGATRTVDIEKLKDFLDKILDSSFDDVNQQCLEVWVSSLSSKDYSLPRKLSKQLISAYNKDSVGKSNVNTAPFVRDPIARKELVSWLSDWKYKSNNQFEVKVLLINLMSRDPSKGIKLSDKKPQFFSGFINAESCHLDHFEPKSLPSLNSTEYFQSESRDDLVNSLGNMMLLTQLDNQRKSDAPASVANKYYASSDIGHNWLYVNLDNLYRSNSDGGVPKEEFFTERKKELISQLADLLHS